MYTLLDVFFFIFHTFLILFNMLGWIWENTRKLNFITLSLTAFSWFGLGIWYGFGYCPSTHWHWLVRRELGYFDMPNSYIKFLIGELTGLDISAAVVDGGAVALFIAAFIISGYLNVRDLRKEG